MHFCQPHNPIYMQHHIKYLQYLIRNKLIVTKLLSYAINPPFVDSPKGFYVNRACTLWRKTTVLPYLGSTQIYSTKYPIYCQINTFITKCNLSTTAKGNLERLNWRMPARRSDILERQNISGEYHTLLFSWMRGNYWFCYGGL